MAISMTFGVSRASGNVLPSGAGPPTQGGACQFEQGMTRAIWILLEAELAVAQATLPSGNGFHDELAPPEPLAPPDPLAPPEPPDGIAPPKPAPPPCELAPPEMPPLPTAPPNAAESPEPFPPVAVVVPPLPPTLPPG